MSGLSNLSNSSQRPSLSIHEEVDVRRKDGLRKKRRQLWLEKEKEWSQNSQPMHDGKSPGPLAIQVVLCNRKLACAVCAICVEWQRSIDADSKAMQPTTSATNHLQPQHTHHWSCTLRHTPQFTHTIVHMVELLWRDWMTTQ